MFAKITPWAPVLFISGFSKAAYNYFKCFGPWTTDVQGLRLKWCVMKVVMRELAACPVKNHRRGQASERVFKGLPAGRASRHRQLVNVAGCFRQFCRRETFQFLYGCFQSAHPASILTRLMILAMAQMTSIGRWRSQPPVGRHHLNPCQP